MSLGDIELGKTQLDNDDMMENTGLLGAGSHRVSSSNIQNQNIPYCGIISIKFYQPYFDVDTSEVYQRILHSTFYCRREANFITNFSSKPDGYGPVWISTTLIFFLSVLSHLTSWLNSWMKGSAWQYDIQSVVTAASLIYSYAFFIPLIVWFFFKQYDPNLTLATVICLYGYSLFVYIPAAILTLIPVNGLIWLIFLTAASSSTIFLLRNLAPSIVQVSPKHSPIFLCGITFFQFVFMLCLKFYFFYEN